jgi:hypothetical protein
LGLGLGGQGTLPRISQFTFWEVDRWIDGGVWDVDGDGDVRWRARSGGRTRVLLLLPGNRRRVNAASCVQRRGVLWTDAE